MYLLTRQRAPGTLDLNPDGGMDDTLQVFPYAWQQQLLRYATIQIVLGCRVLEGFTVLQS